jgi:hypothetical protein
MSDFIYITLLESGEVVKYNSATGEIVSRQPISESAPYDVTVSDNYIFVHDAWQNTPQLVDYIDNVPNQFYFSQPAELERNIDYTTNEIELFGITHDTFASVPDIFNASLIINDVDVGLERVVNIGDKIKLRFDTPGDADVVVKIPVFVGSISTTFESVTAKVRAIPDQFAFDDVSLSSSDTSNTITISGIDPDIVLPFIISGNSTIIHNGIDTGLQQVNVSLDDTIAIKNSSYGYVECDCGLTKDIFLVNDETSYAFTPDVLNYETITGSEPNETHTSEAISISGLGQTEIPSGDPEIPPTILNNSFLIHIEPYPNTTIIKNGVEVGLSVNVVDGDTIAIKTNANIHEYRSITVKLYGQNSWSSSFTIENQIDLIPDTVTFEPIVEAIPRSVAFTQEFTLSGTEPGAEYDIVFETGNELLTKFLNPVFYINGSPSPGTSATVKNGDVVKIEFRVVGATWGGDEITFYLKTDSGFLIGEQKIVTGYLDGVSQEVDHIKQFETEDYEKVIATHSVDILAAVDFDWAKSLDFALSQEHQYDILNSQITKEILANTFVQNNTSEEKSFDAFGFDIQTDFSVKLDVDVDFLYNSTSKIIEKETFFEHDLTASLITFEKQYDYNKTQLEKSISTQTQHNQSRTENLVTPDYFHNAKQNFNSFPAPYYNFERYDNKTYSYIEPIFEIRNYSTQNIFELYWIKPTSNVYYSNVQYVFANQSLEKTLQKTFIANYSRISAIVEVSYEFNSSTSFGFVEVDYEHFSSNNKASIETDHVIEATQALKLVENNFEKKLFSKINLFDKSFEKPTPQDLKLIETSFEKKVFSKSFVDINYVEESHYGHLTDTNITFEEPTHPDSNVVENPGMSDDIPARIGAVPHIIETSLPSFEYSAYRYGHLTATNITFEEPTHPDSNIPDDLRFSDEPRDDEAENRKYKHIVEKFAPTTQNKIGVFAGYFVKGPIGESVPIESKEQLVKVFGKPTNELYNDFYQCYNFLEYGNTLYVLRLGKKKTHRPNL